MMVIMDHGLEEVAFGLQNSSNKPTLPMIMMVFSTLLSHSGIPSSYHLIWLLFNHGKLAPSKEILVFLKLLNRKTNGSLSQTHRPKMS